MPYIDKARRHEINRDIALVSVKGPGELNYLFTLLALDYIDANGNSYQHINDVIGALEGAKLEFYRRHAAPYEDTKIKQNGDVYGHNPETKL